MRTTVQTALYDEKWDKKAIAEYQRASQFLPFMGKGTNKPIIYRPMEARTDNVPFVPDLTGGFVNGEMSRKRRADSAEVTRSSVDCGDWRAPDPRS